MGRNRRGSGPDAACGPTTGPGPGRLPPLSVGTAFHPRTSPLNRKMQWREWSGYFASSVVRRRPRHRVQRDPRGGRADRRLAALQVPRLAGPTRSRWSTGSSPATRRSWPSAASSTRRGATSTARSSTTAPSIASTSGCTAGRRPIRSSAGCARTARGLDVTITEETEATAALALQGPLSRERPRGRDAASRSRTCATSGAGPRRSARSRIDVSRTGYTGDLGYELWIPTEGAVKVWDALMAAGRAYGIRPAGMLALDVVRLEAGLILLEVDYTSARHAMNPEQNYSPGEIGLGRLVSFDKGDFVGRLALEREARAGRPGAAAGRPPARLVRHRGPVRRAGPAAGHQPDGRSRSPVPVFAGWPPGRPGDEPRLEPDPQAGDRASPRSRRSTRPSGTKLERRMDGRGPSWPGRRDRRRAAVPRPAAQARLRHSPGVDSLQAVIPPQCFAAAAGARL